MDTITGESMANRYLPYQKHPPSKAREHYYAVVQTHPGLTAPEFGRLVNRCSTVSTYHLERLVNESRIVRDVQPGKSRIRYYPKGGIANIKTRILPYIHDPIIRDIITRLRQHGPMTTRDIVNNFHYNEYDRRTIRHRLAILERINAVIVQHSGHWHDSMTSINPALQTLPPMPGMASMVIIQNQQQSHTGTADHHDHAPTPTGCSEP